MPRGKKKADAPAKANGTNGRTRKTAPPEIGGKKVVVRLNEHYWKGFVAGRWVGWRPTKNLIRDTLETKLRELGGVDCGVKLELVNDGDKAQLKSIPEAVPVRSVRQALTQTLQQVQEA